MGARAGIVGGFILGAIGLGVAAILFFGGTRVFTKTLLAVAFFNESVAGLDVGAPVTFHGVRVGLVKSVRLEFSAAAMSARTPVVLEFQPEQVTWEGGRKLTDDRKDFDRLIQAGLRAKLEMQSLVTGQLRVNLEFLPGTPTVLAKVSTDLPQIPTLPSELSQLTAELSKLHLQDLSDTMQRAFASFDRLARHVDSVLDPVVGNANDALVAARQAFRTGDAAIARLSDEASGTLRDVDGLMVDARHQLNPRATELSRVLNSADRAVRQAATLLESLNSVAQSRSQFRGNLEAAMRDLAAATASLRDFATTIERDPNALLMGRGRR